MPAPIVEATLRATVDDLELMTLDLGRLPPGYSGYQAVRDGPLDNRDMAQNGFPGATEERFQKAGRIAGYMREFGPPMPQPPEDGSNFVVASVAHLFETHESVEAWMHEVFLHDFQQNVGQEIGHDQTLVEVRQLDPTGFYDEAVAIKAVHSNPAGLVSSTVIDFRVGRILGVAFVGTVGDHQRLDEASEIAIALEKNIVSVVLGL